ncbi:arginine--tRNA ligase [Candidatus Gottesmanbacteria bacterium]|nr:arginine--tRNA ligase [Candidatus Gottesmanbacteria bacterium]
MKKQLQEAVQSVLRELGVSGLVPDVEIPENSLHGEYTTNVAMRLVKVLKKPPMEIAEKIKNAVSLKKQHLNTSKKSQTRSVKFGKSDPFSVLQAIDRVGVAPPGFINFFLTEAKFSTEVSEVLKEKEAYGTSQQKGKRIVVEFTDPNPFKEFHIGHLYSNAVGESICRLFEASGQDVRRVNYQGDVGMHVAKAIWGMQKKLKAESAKFKVEDEMKKLEKLPLSERVKWMGEAYALGATAYEEDPAAAEEMKRLNKLIYDKDESIKTLYESGRAWSLAYFETLYQRLGTTFKGYYFESKAGEVGVEKVQKHITDGIFEKSDGAIIFRGEKFGLHTRVFINKLGLPTYEAKELGLAPMKYEDWPYDASYIITAKEIDEYFKVLIAAMKQVAPELGEKTTHIGHGMVRLPEGKMSSRTGKILTGEWLLDSLKQKIYTIINKSKTKYDTKESELIAERAAVAAVKYSLLKVALPSDITFDLESSVSFEGDSGPYLLYTYARCKSVLRKARRQESKKAENISFTLHASRFTLNPEERSIARLIVHFPDVVAEAAANLSPSTIAGYVSKLAAAFNLFYAKHTILASKHQGVKASKNPDALTPDTMTLRLTLTAATAHVIATSLHLLGIQTVERM